jgi:multiple antibiotic resistance protein
MTVAERRRQALLGTVSAVAILVVFLLFGRFVLDFFGVSLAAIEFVGGLVIAVVGWEMLTQSAVEELEGPDREDEVFFSPIAFPLLAGPGALAVTLGLSNRHDSWLDYPGFVTGIVAIAAISYLILRHADRVLERMGPKAIDVVNRILGLIVLAIAAELAFNGIADHFGLTVTD